MSTTPPSSATVSAYCACGDSLTVSAAGHDPVGVVEGIAETWREVHEPGTTWDEATGSKVDNGHGPVTREIAAIARRKRDRQARRRG